MAVQAVSSWGNVIRAEYPVFELTQRDAPFPDVSTTSSVLPHGNGRSYGDSCLNVGGGLLKTRSLDRFIAFDRGSGLLTCEAGVLLDDVLRLAVRQGWFVPVTPGTRFVTVGGAIANDVHGKNPHRAGNFARHVVRFELLRSDGQRLLCSPQENPDWFAATVGGLGLTGVITWAQLQLRPVAGPLLDVETVRFSSLDEFVALGAESDRDFEYTVAWIDCMQQGAQLGRGILQRGNHAPVPASPATLEPGRLTVPVAPPFSLINGASSRLFNLQHYHRQRAGSRRGLERFEGFFYPLDGILHWNRMYGPRGFYQYQCVVPTAGGRDATAALLQCIARSGQASFLAVLKAFGDLPSTGMLSFPREGLTLAVDFPNRGAALERLFRDLDTIVEQAGGRLYPAKDGRMPGRLFRSGYPRWQEFSRFIDPRCSSSFWRRVTGDA